MRIEIQQVYRNSCTHYHVKIIKPHVTIEQDSPAFYSKAYYASGKGKKYALHLAYQAALETVRVLLGGYAVV